MKALWLTYIFDSITKTRTRESGEGSKEREEIFCKPKKGPQKKKKSLCCLSGEWGDKGESKLQSSFMNGSRGQEDPMGKEVRLPCYSI